MRLLSKNLNNNQFYPNEISHKELNTLLIKAKKTISLLDTSHHFHTKENDELKELITDWVKTSQKILVMLNKKDKILTKNRHPKSLIAFGAMGAHINMALQALKATEFEQ